VDNIYYYYYHYSHGDIYTNQYPCPDDLLKGAPCAVQLFTTTLRDEECLHIAKEVDGILNSKG
jgi:hypothetical protein